MNISTLYDSMKMEIRREAQQAGGKIKQETKTKREGDSLIIYLHFVFAFLHFIPTRSLLSIDFTRH